MRASFIPLALAPLALAQTVNITKTEDVDLASKTGELGWGADNLAFGYSAGAGLNFSSGMSPFLFLDSFSYGRA
jgi:hypothetical protein